MIGRIRPTISLVGFALVLAGCGEKTAPKDVLSRPSEAPKATTAPEPKKPPQLALMPATLQLIPGDSGAQLLLSGEGTHGGRVDRVRNATWTADPPGIVEVGPDGFVKPVKPGKATISYAVGDSKGQAKIEVATAADRPWDFAADIVPILTRQGCNVGGCHGKADGQNGFHLSLFGYDPEGDYRSITRDSAGRRVSAMTPDSSLLLEKATGRVPHAGGQKIAPGSEPYLVLRDWLIAGAPELRGKSHGPVAKISVEPSELRLDEPGVAQIRVVATYADGHTRDVTRLSSMKVNDDSAAEITPEGRATLLRRAETDLIVRYGSQVVSARLSTMINPELKYDFSKLPRTNVVDRELFKRLEALKVPPSPPASDTAFLRRVTLDLTGQQPDTSQVREFLADKSPDKRVKKVDELLKRPEFVTFWQIKLGDMLQISEARIGPGTGRYRTWINKRLSENTPWDSVVRDLLTSVGNPAAPDGGPVNYALDGIDAKAAAEQTAQRFLGLRLRCAQCHDHPFDIWTQDDYFGLAAIFAKVGRGAPGPGAMMNRPRIAIDPKGQIEHLRTRKPAEMRLLDHQVVKTEGEEDPRKALANWMTKTDNPYFARATSNWVWAQFFGRGIAEPADDLSRANPPVHPELLDALAKHFVESKYDLRELIRTVATSEAYGLSSASLPENEKDTRLFSHAVPRPLTAHQMADCIATVTGVPLRFNRAGFQNTEASKETGFNEPSFANSLLDAFGRCPRTVGCSAVATPSLSLRQSLLLIGGDAIDGKVGSINGYLSNLLGDKDMPEAGDLVELLYLKSLCRPPTSEELSHWSAELKGAPSFREAAEDLFWALLNSREFAFNH